MPLSTKAAPPVAVFGREAFFTLNASDTAKLKNSGFNTAILFVVDVEDNGDLNYNGDHLVVTNGVYMGDANWGARLAALKVAPTSITRIEVCTGGAGAQSWAHIKSLIATNGTGPTSILYKNFLALKNAIHMDAICNDDEVAYDAASAATFNQMITTLGMKNTLCPYNNQIYWENVFNNSAIDAIYLQCYDGGGGNNPAAWNGYFGGFQVAPGDWSNDGLTTVASKFNSWSPVINGGFIWQFENISAADLASYGAIINKAVDPLVVTPGIGFSGIAAYNLYSFATSTPFVLTNRGDSSLTWSVINTSNWLTVSSSLGALGSGAAAPVTVSLNTTVATNLAQGVYTASIIFSNRASGVTVARNFTLNTALANWPITLTGYNAAILASNNATAGKPGATAFDVKNGYCFYQQGLSGSAEGLPLAGIFSSQSDSLTAFKLGAFGAPDVLMLGYTYASSGTLSLTTPQAYNSLAILSSSANGSSSGQGTFVLNFVNGTKSPPFAYNCQDWFYVVTNVAIQGFGRLKLGSSLSIEDNGSSNPNLYQTTVNLAALGITQPIASITFSNRVGAGSMENTAIFAVSGMPANIPMTPPTGLVAIPGTNATVKLSWNGVVGATNYNIKRSTISGLETIVANANATSYLDTGLAMEQIYYYVVSAVGVANESANSAEASAVLSPPIALVDGPSTTVAGSFQSASASINRSFTVSSNATVLVVLWTDKSSASGSQPPLLLWTVAGRSPQVLRSAVTANNGANVFRDNTIYYLYNPAPGTGLITGTAGSGVVGNGAWLVAFTLKGINTNAAPLTGAVNNNPGGASSGNGTFAVTNTVTGVPANSWAAISSSLSANSSNVITLTNGVGTVTTTTDTSDAGSGVTMGYVSGLAFGTDGFMAVGGMTNKMVLVEAIFSPLTAVAPPASPQVTGIDVAGTTLSISATNGTAGGSWILLQSTNLALPLSQWQTNRVGVFDGNGQLSTNLVNAANNDRKFYLLKVQ